VHLRSAHADDGKDEESLSAAGLEGGLFGLTSIVAVVVIVECMNDNWIEESRNNYASDVSVPRSNGMTCSHNFEGLESRRKTWELEE